LDHVLVQKAGYLSEYYGKWHLPDKLWYSHTSFETKNDYNNNTTSGIPNNIIHYNDYDFAKNEFYFVEDSDGKKNQRYLDYWSVQGLIDRTLQEGQQYDTYSGYPYTPIQLDARARHQSAVGCQLELVVVYLCLSESTCCKGLSVTNWSNLRSLSFHYSQTGTPLTTSRGFEVYEVTQPNILGQYALSEDYTPSHFTGQLANEALKRFVNQSDPWFLTVSFHNPHPPMVPAWKYLEYYWNKRDKLFLSPNMNDDLSNSAYGNIIDQIPDYQVLSMWKAKL
jgi:hypothetical protein